MKEFFNAVSSVLISSVYFRNKDGIETHSFHLSMVSLGLGSPKLGTGLWMQHHQCWNEGKHHTSHDLLAVVFLMQAKMCLASYFPSVYWWLVFSLMCARFSDLFLQIDLYSISTVWSPACTGARDCSGLFCIPIVWFHQVPVGPHPQLLWALWMAIQPFSMQITPSNFMWCRDSWGSSFSLVTWVINKVNPYQF